MDEENITLKGMALYVETPRGRKPMRRLILRAVSKRIRVYADGTDFILRAAPKQASTAASSAVTPPPEQAPLAPKKRWAARGARQKRRGGAPMPPPEPRAGVVLRTAADFRNRMPEPTPPSTPPLFNLWRAAHPNPPAPWVRKWPVGGLPPKRRTAPQKV